MVDAPEIRVASAGPATATSLRDHTGAWGVAGLALLVYGLTLAPDLSWANASTDGGELIAASVTLGIPHPPGYPTYVVLGKLFSLLPWGTVAWRYNLFSAVCVAAAAGLLVLVMRTMYPSLRLRTVVAAALAFAFAPLVWSQAVVAEVYGLNLLLLALFLLLWSRRGASVAAGLALGLAITAHLTAIFFLSALLITGGRQAWRPLAGILLGLTPLLLLPFFARGDSPIVWGKPTDAAGWWQVVSGRLYAANFQPARLLEQLPQLLSAVAIGPALLAGAAQLSTRTEAILSDRPTRRWLAATALLYIAFALAYATPDAAVLLIPALLLLTVLIAPALNRLGALALVLPLVLLLTGYPLRDLSAQPGPRTAAESLLQAAPADALLLTPGDRTIFTLWYFQHAEGLRPDLRLVDENLFAFDWYRAKLRETYPDIFVPAGDDLTALHDANNATRPVCTAILSAGGSALVGSPLLECDEALD